MKIRGDIIVGIDPAGGPSNLTAALTDYLHLRQKTELVGDRIEGYIVVPIKSDWRLLKP